MNMNNKNIENVAGDNLNEKELTLELPKKKTSVQTLNAQDIKQDFIIGNIDSKTKGYERFADCFELANGPLKNSIKISMFNGRGYRI